MAAAFSTVPPFLRYVVMPGYPEGVIADLGLDAGGAGALADHGVGVGLQHECGGEPPNQ